MEYRRNFRVPVLESKIVQLNKINAEYGAQANKFSSYLPEVYSGSPNRLERYNQYDQMDNDSDVNASLDVIADFATSPPEHANTPFEIVFHNQQDLSSTEIDIIKQGLLKWCNINDLHARIWRIFRSTIKYGDQFFLRDPETFELYWIDHAKVQGVIVNPAQGKVPEYYIVYDLDMNLQAKVATLPRPETSNMVNYISTVNKPVSSFPGGSLLYNQPNIASWLGKRRGVSTSPINEVAISAEHIVHFSLSEGLDALFPFGSSILESVFKVYKQKELLEDALLIYRVQRAPERRVFYVDVGNMPPHKAIAYVERIKNEIHQRRIPSRTGGGTSILDASYNPLSILEDYFFPVTAEGRGSKVETLPAGENLGTIDDLLYFSNKLKRGLRVPSSYLPTGPEDSSVTYNDGKVGTAYIQEYRFAKYIERLQRNLQPTIDKEFKLFLQKNGINIDPDSFYIQFWAPQNFGKYRQLETDAAQIQVFTSLSDIPWLSKRFLAKRYLGLTDDELLENEKLWLEENTEQDYEGIQEKTKEESTEDFEFENEEKNRETLDNIETEDEFGEQDSNKDMDSEEVTDDISKEEENFDLEDLKSEEDKLFGDTTGLDFDTDSEKS